MTAQQDDHSLTPRNGILKLNEDRLAELRSGSLTRPILNYFGIAGSGKTVATRQIAAQLSAELPVISVEVSNGALSQDRSGGVSARLPELAALLGRLPWLDSDLELPEDDDAVQSMQLAIMAPPPEELPGLQQLLLIIDGASEFNTRALWSWLQERVLLPLASSGASMIILTSYQKLYVNHDLLDYCKPEPLPRFDTEEIKAFLRRSDFGNLEPLAAEITDYTRGYPLALRHFVQQFRRSAAAGELSAVAAELLLERLSPGAQALFASVGVVRLAEVDAMLEALQKLDHNRYTRRQVVAALSELEHAPTQEDESAPLIEEYLSGLPRRLSARLRAAWIVRIGDERYTQICAELAQIYYRRAWEQPKTRVYAFLEWLYYSTYCLRDGNGLRLAQWQEELHRLYLRMRTAQSGDQKTANPLVVSLYYYDYELQDRLRAVSAQLRQHGQPIDLGQLVRQGMSELFARLNRMNQRPLEELGLNVFRQYFDGSCEGTLRELSRRMPEELLPDRLREQDVFVRVLRELMRTSTHADLDEAGMRSAVSAVSFLAPDEATQLIRAFSNRGLLSYDTKQRTYSFRNEISQLVAYGDMKAALKEPLAVAPNTTR